jgi:hypothetical protein
MTHYAISFYVINQAYGDGHPFYWIPPSKHIKMQLATPHVAEQLNRYHKLTENKIQEMCQASIFLMPAALNPQCNLYYLYYTVGQKMACLQPVSDIFCNCQWPNCVCGRRCWVLWTRQQQGLWKSSEIVCKGKRMSRMFAYFKNTLHKLWIWI